MKNFSAMDWFRAKGTNIKTRVKAGGLKFKLEGAPTQYTDEQLAVLASHQTENVRVSTPPVETQGGLSTASSGEFTGNDVCQLIIACTGIGQTEKPKAKAKETAQA